MIEKDIANLLRKAPFLKELNGKEKQERLKEMLLLLSQIRNKFGDQVLLNILKNSQADYSNYSKTLARVLNYAEANQAAMNPDLLKTLTEAELSLLPSMIGDEIVRAADLIEYEQLFMRHPKWVQSRFTSTRGDSEAIRKLGTPLLLVGIRNPAMVSNNKAEQREFLLSALRLMARRPSRRGEREGWQYDQEQVAEELRKSLSARVDDPKIKN